MITAERLRSVLSYDPRTGIFIWKQRKGRIRKGAIAGNRMPIGYVQIMVDNKNYTAHRLAWLYVYGKMPSSQVDHKNRIRDDNRIDNLRLATPRQNGANSWNEAHNSSGYKGVSFNRYTGRYEAYISLSGRKKHLGRFNTPVEAHRAYCKVARQVFGEFFCAGG